MSKATIVTLVGALIIFLNLIYGFPSAWVRWVTVLAGVTVVVLGLLMRVERLWMLRALAGGHKTDAYAENTTPKAQNEVP